MGTSFADMLADALSETAEKTRPAPESPFAQSVRAVESRVASATIASMQPDVPAWARTLNVSPFAAESDLKKAFKRRAFETHPDRGGSPTLFIAAKRALDEALSSVLALTTPPTARAAAAYR